MRLRPQRWPILALCAALCLTLLSGCSFESWLKELAGNDPAPVPEARERLCVGLYAADSLHPFTAETRTNRRVLSLCYPGLISVDRTFSASCELASSFSTDGNRVTLTLSGALFSDGTPVTAYDCVYSYREAQKSGHFDDVFSTISAYEAVSSDTFCVTFTEPSVYNVLLLTVPVIKEGTTERFAVGAGRYVLKASPDENGGDTVTLYRNPYRENTANESTDVIRVRFLDSLEEMLYAFNYGGVDVLESDLGSGGLRYRTNAETVVFASERLTFAAVNPKSGKMNYAGRNKISEALALLISRDEINTTILNGNGIAVWTPFIPTWQKAADADFVSDIADRDACAQAFYEGRWYRNPTSGELEWYGEKIRLTVIVCAGNVFETKVAALMAKKLNDFGVTADVSVLTRPDYDRAVASGKYDIRIATASWPRNMDLGTLLSDAGVSVSANLRKAIRSFNAGTLSLTELAATFRAEQPLVPLYVTNRALLVNTRVQGTFLPSRDDLFGGIDTWFLP